MGVFSVKKGSQSCEKNELTTPAATTATATTATTKTKESIVVKIAIFFVFFLIDPKKDKKEKLFLFATVSFVDSKEDELKEINKIGNELNKT